MEGTSWVRRFADRADRLVPGLVIIGAGLALVEAVLVARWYPAVHHALGLSPWRIGAHLVATVVLVAAAAGSVTALLASLSRRPTTGGRVGVIAGALVGGALALWFGSAMTMMVFPGGLVDDRSANRLLTVVVVAGVSGAAAWAGMTHWLLRRRRSFPGRPVAVALASLALLVVWLPWSVAPLPPSAAEYAPATGSAPLEGRTVLLVTVDTLRASHMSLYGYPRMTTPGLDAWAQEQVVFARAVTPKPYTSPALASLMTGLPPQVHGLRRHPGVLREELRTLPQMFADAGYHTAAFVTNPAVRDRAFQFDRGFEEWFEYPDSRSGADVVLGDAARWLEESPAAPLFLWIHLFDPHSPYRPPPPHDRRFVDDDLYGRHADVEIAHVPGHAGAYELALREALGGDWEELGIPERRLLEADFFVARYDGEIAFLDEHLAPFLQRFRTRFSDSLAVLTADHGESMVDHGYMFSHGRYCYEATAHVPLVLSHASFPPGRVSGLASLIDLVPTMADLLGLDPPATVTGRSLAATLLEAGGDRRVPFARSVRLESRSTSSYPTLALRTEDEKLILTPSRVLAPLDLLLAGQLRFAGPETVPQGLLRSYGVELYDLEEDPGETRDLAAERPDRVAALSAELWQRARGDALQRRLLGATGEARPELDAGTLEELRALGYIR